MGETVTFGSLFSGIGGFDLGFEQAGMTCAWQVEREPFCQKVLRRRFDKPVFDDVTTVGSENLERVDVLVGGFPCQDLSVAGKREGLAGERSGLFYEFVRIADELQPKAVVIENVPGLLTSRGGRDFYALLSILAERGWRRAYRILDSRYFGVAQRRRRVFLVLCAGTGGHDPATVLFESEGRGWSPASSDEARASVAATLRGRSARRGVNAPGRGGEDDSNLISHSLTNQHGVTEDGTGRGVPVIAFDERQITSRENRSNPQPGDPCHTLHAGAPSIAFSITANYGDATLRGDGSDNIVSFDWQSGGDVRHNVSDKPSLHSGQTPAVMVGERARALTASMHKRHDEDTDTLIPTMSSSGAGTARVGGQNAEPEFYISGTLPANAGVRRLTPLECERLQGFPDGWTCLCGEGHRGSIFCTCPDTPRYKALGNAVTVNVAKWIGDRLVAASL